MAELVDAPDSKSGDFGRLGSTPSIPTKTKVQKMRIINVLELDYQEPIIFFQKLKGLDGLTYLDSAGKDVALNQYSYIAALPVLKIHKKKSNIFIDNKTSNSSFFEIIEDLLDTLQAEKIPNLPSFQCGLAGFISYESCLDIEKIKNVKNSNYDFDDIWFGLYDVVFAFDHKKRKTYVFSVNLDDYQANTDNMLNVVKSEYLLNLYKNDTAIVKEKHNFNFEWKPYQDKDSYKQSINKILEYIKAGDIFQANFTHCFFASNNSLNNHFDTYLNYRKKTQTPFSAFISNNKDDAVCSFSPERLLSLDDKIITAAPIKGTTPRGLTDKQDKALIEDLVNSKKNLAENLMIVDVLRNDISRVSITGSVEVKKLASLETYENVHHLVSYISSRIQPGKKAVDLLKACLPGASVTGAPKIRAMEIISELEETARGPYCGALGYISLCGSLDMNIPIRTILLTKDKIVVNCGGGIVSDSDSELEYQESIDKISNLLNTNYDQSQIKLN
jgi:para-aminobenzoate synthetase component 1|tara:strand:- start:6811 stop:8316 length:1506 start_codon:yes stop_codon:yes gene_type:complete